MPTKLIHSVARFDSELTPDSWVLFSETETRIGTGDDWRGLVSRADEVVEGRGQVLLSGLIDTHCHGAAGHTAQQGLASMRAILEHNHSVGVAGSLLSLVTAGHGELVDLCKQAEALSDDPRFLGLHLEGPYLSPAKKGAHDESLLAQPTRAELEQLLSISSVKSITIAPELFSDELLGLLADSGVRVCIGHTTIDYQQAKAAFERFPTAVLTHAFNGMNGIHHREPGPVPAAIDAGVGIELIADGIHVASAVARLLPSDRVILVTDAMAAAGMPDGNYELGSLSVTVSDGVARTDYGSLAGSTLALATAVLNYAEWIGDPLAALRAATTNPAERYGFRLPELSLENHLLLPLAL